jgi:hypothetical protein
MRRMSVQRRRVVVLASSVAAMSGVGPLLFARHSWLRWGWMGLMAALLAAVIVLMVRLRRDEGCA